MLTRPGPEAGQTGSEVTDQLQPVSSSVNTSQGCGLSLETLSSFDTLSQHFLPSEPSASAPLIEFLPTATLCRAQLAHRCLLHVGDGLPPVSRRDCVYDTTEPNAGLLLPRPRCSQARALCCFSVRLAGTPAGMPAGGFWEISHPEKREGQGDDREKSLPLPSHTLDSVLRGCDAYSYCSLHRH